MRRLMVAVLAVLLLSLAGARDAAVQSVTRSGDWVLTQEDLAQGEALPYQPATESFLQEDLGDGTPGRLTYQGYAQYLSPVRRAAFPFNAVGAQWTGHVPEGSYVFMEIRVSDDGATWSEWLPAAEVDQFAGEGVQSTDLVLTEGTFLQFRLSLLADDPALVPTVQEVRLTYIDATTGPSAEALAPAEEEGGYRTLAVTPPPVITRASWGANEGYRYRNGRVAWPPAYAAPKKLIIHHSGSAPRSDPAATVRAIYYYHAVTLGWGDIGYNYIIDGNGRVYEGRYGGARSSEHVIGAHARQFNPGSIGIAILGNFTTTAPPAAAQTTLTTLVARFAQQYNINVLGSGYFVSKVMANVAGHRDCYSTACPGDQLYKLLPSIRQRAAQIIAADGGDVPPAPPAPPDSSTPGTGAGTITTATGGSVSLGGIQVIIPAGASTTATSLKVTLASAGIPATELPPEGTLFGSQAFTLSITDPDGTAIPDLARDLQIVVPYQDRDLYLAGNAPQRVHVYHDDEATGTWRHVRDITDATARTVRATTTETGRSALVAEVLAPTGLTSPAGGVVFGLDTALSWTNPPNTAQYQIQVLPANLDGPAINLIVGRQDLVQAARFRVPSPILGTGPYVMLPGMTYLWRVRTTPLTTPLGENDPGWSKYVEGTFRTVPPTSTTISPVRPAPNSSVTSQTPTLQWVNADPYIFYYELQLSKDATFTTDPAQATAAVYALLVHGGTTDPLNSWTVPADFALEPGQTYHWRVRPRVQGDGTPVAWSTTWSFRTP